MKQIQYTGSSKLISRIVHLLNRKAPLPLDGDGDADWGTSGQVLTTDGNGNTSWTTPQGGGGDVTDVEVNGTSVVNAQGVAEVSVPTATSDLNNDSGFIDGTDLSTALSDYTPTSSLATVATSGDYDDLTNKPTIPSAQVQSDWSQADNTQVDYIKNKPSIPTALADLTDDSTHRVVTDTQISTWNGKSDFSGSYNDLTDKPTIPTVNDGTLTIQQNGTTLGTFSANQSGNTTVNITGGGGSTYTEGDGIDISSQNVISVDTTFTEASTRANIASGDSLATIWGKIKKWFTDIPNMFVSKSGDTMSGNLTIDLENGTVSTEGMSKLILGNNKAIGTDKNSTAIIEMFSDSGKKNTLYSESLTADHYVGLPNKDGTVALTSDVDTKVSKTGDTMSGNLATPALHVSGGRVYGSGDDEGIVVNTASNGLAGVCLGVHNGKKAVLYYRDGTPSTSWWRLHTGSGQYDIAHPAKSGTIALTDDIPTNNNQLTNGAGYITSSGSCASATTASYANLLKYSHTNEVNFSGGKQSTVQINFRNADTDSTDGGAMEVEYQFCNYGGANNISKTTVTAGRFKGTADAAAADGNGNNIASTYLPLAGGTMTGRLDHSTLNDVAVNYRTGNNDYNTTVSYQTGGNEALVFATKNHVTSFMFVNGEDSITNHASNRWQSLVPALQMKSGKVAIGKRINNNVSPTSYLDVGGYTNIDGELRVQNNVTLLSDSNRENVLTLCYNNATMSRLWTSSNGTLHVNTNTWMNLEAGSQVQCRNTADTGWVPCAASSYPGTGSSRKVKENIKPLTEDEAKKILDIETVTFDYKETHIADKSRFGWRGVIAEDVEPIIPSAVVYGVDRLGNPCVSSVDYMRFVPYLIKMVQMQQSEIDTLKAEIAELKGVIK